MRLDELVLRIPGDEFRIRFHEHLTVLAGIGVLERQALGESLIGALSGTADTTVLTYTDNTGRPVEIVCDPAGAAARYLDDDTPALLPLGSVAQSTDELRSLMLVEAAELGLNTARARAEDDPELQDARATLAKLTEELQRAMASRREQQDLSDELDKVEEQIRHAEDGAARRVYAKVLAELEKVRAESATLQGGKAGADGDRHLLAVADDARELARRWTNAARRVAELTTAFGNSERLDPDTLTKAHRFPTSPPDDLAQLLADVEDARVARDRLDHRLRDRATSTLPDPSDPRVLSLATADQAVLWGARDRVAASNRLLQREQLAVGGPAADGSVGGGVAAEIVHRIEEAQRAVDATEAVRRRYFVPSVAGSALAAVLSLMLGTIFPAVGLVILLGAIAGAVAGIGVPWRRVMAAALVEKRALADAGAETYLGFHLRRVDAATDRGSHNRLEAAALEHRLALGMWEELAPGIDVDTATALEQEARRYADAVSKLGGAAGEIEALRAELTGRAEPALAAATATLLETCAPYGVDQSAIDDTDASLVSRLVQTHLALGERARAQVALERAEDVANDLAADLEEMLRKLGFEDGELDARVGALDWAVDRAFEREQSRIAARSREAIDADLERLQDEVDKLRRPEWVHVQPSDADGPEPAQLRQRAEELRASLAEDREVVIDLERLADRHSAMERRVAALEAAHGGGEEDHTSVGELADVHQYLLAHLTKAGHAGPFDESVPVILDDAFVQIAAERKWELLDMLRRLGEKTQLIYLTDDPFVGAWARRRAAAGLITLLEPVDA